MITYKQYLMASLSEEAGEVVQMAGKVLRFYDLDNNIILVPSDRTDLKEGNALELLQIEIIDLLVVVELLHDVKVFSDDFDVPKMVATKKERLDKYWQMVKEAQERIIEVIE